VSPRYPVPAWEQGTGAEKEKRTRSRRTKKAPPQPQVHEITLMVRHLPLHYSPAGLLQEVQAFLPNINFFYLPTHFESASNLGYAFFNFDDKLAAARFEEFWMTAGISGECNPEDPEDVIVQPARVQGLEANVERFRNSSVMKMLPEYLKPRIFNKGVPQAFPEAEKSARPFGPRFRPTEA
jgi:hypothetical protein